MPSFLLQYRYHSDWERGGEDGVSSLPKIRRNDSAASEKEKKKDGGSNLSLAKIRKPKKKEATTLLKSTVRREERGGAVLQCLRRCAEKSKKECSACRQAYFPLLDTAGKKKKKPALFAVIKRGGST